MSNYFNRYWIIIVGILLLSLITGGVLMVIELGRHHPVEITLESRINPEYKFEVFIDGAVANPGYYPARKEDTIVSIVQSAGLASGANLDRLKIHVSTIHEIDSKQKTQKIDLNRAETWLLEALPGIGQSRAQAIVDYRNKFGYFHNVNELLKVNGMSKTILDNIKSLVVLEE